VTKFSEKRRIFVLKICQIVTENWVSGGRWWCCQIRATGDTFMSSLEKSCQFSPNLPSDVLASLAQKSCQFSQNLRSDARLFGSKELPV
jgi:hypothetical protein